MRECGAPLATAVLLSLLALSSCSSHSHTYSLSAHSTAAHAHHLAHTNKLGLKSSFESAATATTHPFQSWLHGYLRGIGKELSATGGRPGTHLAGDLMRQPLLHPEQIMFAHNKIVLSNMASLNQTDGDASGNATDEGATAEEESAGPAAPGPPKEIDINSNIYMDEGDFAKHAEAWMQENRTMMEFCLRWMLLGICIFLAATGLLVYSEVRMVYLTREIDACIVEGKAMDRNLAWRKDKVENWRGYMTFGAVFFLIVSLCMVLFPLCRMATSLLLSMGYAFNGCYLLAFTMAFLCAIIWALFVCGLCWSCTRPWTAAILIVLALLGQGALDSGAAPAIVLWVLVSLLVGWVWLKWGKSLVNETPYTDEEKERLLPSDP